MSIRASLLLFLAPALLAGVSLSASAHGTLRFDHGLWFDGESFRPGTWLSREGVLSRAEDGAPADSVVDLSGLWVVPPLADAHTHALADSRDPATEAALFVKAGILFAKNPNSTWGGMRRGREAIAQGQPGTLFAVHSGSGITSPGGHPAQIYTPSLPEGSGPDGWVPVASVAELDAAWPRIVEAKPDFVKVYLESSEAHARRREAPEFFGKRGLDPLLVKEVVTRARAADLTVSAHVRTVADFRAAVISGVDEVNHLPLGELSPLDGRACAERGVTVVTTVLSHRPTDGVADVEALHRKNLELLRDEGVRLALGTDNMQVDVVDELIAIASYHVFEPAALVRLATTETIRAVRRTRPGDTAGAVAGTLQEGAEATFLALRGDPLADPAAFRQIAKRYVRGHFVAEPAVAPPKPSLADALGEIVMHESLDAALARYAEWRRERPDDFDFGEPQLNALGYALLRHGMAAEAVRIFTLNTEQFPTSPNAWDSLAEAQLAAGDTAGAAKSSEKVLELLPASRYTDQTKASLEASARGRLGR